MKGTKIISGWRANLAVPIGPLCTQDCHLVCIMYMYVCIPANSGLKTSGPGFCHWLQNTRGERDLVQFTCWFYIFFLNCVFSQLCFVVMSKPQIEKIKFLLGKYQAHLFNFTQNTFICVHMYIICLKFNVSRWFYSWGNCMIQ